MINFTVAIGFTLGYKVAEGTDGSPFTGAGRKSWACHVVQQFRKTVHPRRAA